MQGDTVHSADAEWPQGVNPCCKQAFEHDALELEAHTLVNERMAPTACVMATAPVPPNALPERSRFVTLTYRGSTAANAITSALPHFRWARVSKDGQGRARMGKDEQRMSKH